MICWLGALVFFTAHVQPVWGQDDPNTQRGAKPFGTYEGGDIDIIDLSNGSLSINIPLVSYPQRGGKLGLSFKLHYQNNGNYYDRTCAPQGGSCGYDGLAYFSHGFSIIREGGFHARGDCQAVPGTFDGSRQCSASIRMDDGPVHQLLPITPSRWVSADGSGFQATVNPLSLAPLTSVTDANGIRSTVLHHTDQGTIEDTNGNTITVTADNYIDTMGRVIPNFVSGLPDSARTTDYAGCTGPLPTTSAYIWNLPGFDGGSYQIKFCYGGPVTEISNFGTLLTSQAFPLQSVVLPDGSAWTFEYTTDTKGDLKQITFPDGGTLSYTWASPAPLEHNHTYIFTRGVAARTLNPNDGVTPAGTWAYTYTRATETATTTIRDPDLNESVHTFIRHPQHTTYYESQAQFFQGSSQNGTLLMTERNDYKHFDRVTGTVLRIRETTIWPDGKQAKTEFDYDEAITFHNAVFTSNGGFHINYDRTYQSSYGLTLATREYDYGTGSSGPLLKSTLTRPLALINGDYLNNNLLNLPDSVTVTDGAGRQESHIYFTYDGAPLVPSGITTQHNSQPSAGLARGNLVSINRWLNGNRAPTATCSGSVNGYVTATNTYYDTGTVAQARDACGHTTTFAYSAAFAGAYLTQTTTPAPNGSTAGFTSSKNYDFVTGLVTSSTDANQQTTTYEYQDPFNRLTRVNRPDGGWTAYEYGRSPGNPSGTRYIVTRTSLDASRAIQKVQFFDGLSRPTRKFQAESESSYLAIDKRYDSQGRTWRVSNPYRVAETDDPINPSGEWTTTQYDGLDRTIRVTTPDGGSVNTIYSSNQVTVIDQADKRRHNEYDAMSRLIRVTEDPGGPLNYATTYLYDAMGNLRKVTQGTQTRYFAYDADSRLIRVKNPEQNTNPNLPGYTDQLTGNSQWSASHAYDSNGNLIEKTDARGVRTTMAYDALNRITSKTYSGTTDEGRAAANATQPVFFYYDNYSTLPSGAPTWPGTPSKGRLTGVTYGTGSEGTYRQYDARGRIVTNHQRMGTANYVTRYNYNLAGDVLTERRGSPTAEFLRTSSIYDAAGRLKQMMTSFTPFLTESILVSDITYTPFGALQSETYGNDLIHSIGYNNRLQPTEIRLGRSDNLESVFTIYNIFGTAQNPNVPDPEITLLGQNNGNIARIKYSIGGTIQYTQTFLYDALNRLQYAVEHNHGNRTDAARAWYQTCEYDRFGNRGIDTANTSDNVDDENTALRLADFSGANNRIIRAGHAYDSAGNLIAAPGQSHTYDAENRLVKSVVNGVVSEYVYDGFGQRVKKVVGGVGTRFEYDSGGKLIGERSESTGALTKGYFYRNGELLAITEDGTTHKFGTADHLGSPRAWTDRFGNLTPGGRDDFLPSGKELGSGIGIRNASIGYGDDSVRQKFTGKEFDGENGLNFFGARYYSSVDGRFVSVDPLEPALELNQLDLITFTSSPQSWNRYIYVNNNPLKYIDRDGRILHLAVGFGAGAIFGGGFEAAKQLLSNKPLDWRKIGVAALAGGVSGTLTAATGGVSLLGIPAVTSAVAKVGVTVGASMVQGVIERGLDGDSETEVFDGEAMLMDAVYGGVGGVMGDKFAEGYMDGLARKARNAYNRSKARANSAKTRQGREAARRRMAEAEARLDRLNNLETRGGIFAVTSAFLSGGSGKFMEEYMKNRVQGGVFGAINMCGIGGNSPCVKLVY
jgi:RHS repeat-associated protein